MFDSIGKITSKIQFESKVAPGSERGVLNRCE